MHTASSNRRRPVSIAIASMALLAACATGPSEPFGAGVTGVDFLLGNGASDTASAVLLQALVVQVLDHSGAPAARVAVRFESVSPSGSYYSPEAWASRIDGRMGALFAVDTTDANGRARAMVQLGTKAGPARIIVRVPELAYVDTARYTVRPGNLKAVRFATRDTALIVGSQYATPAAGVDNWGNRRPNDAVTYESISPEMSVNAGTVVAQSAGRGTVVAHLSSFTDTMRVSVVPDFTLSMVYSPGSTSSVASMRLDGSSLALLTTIGSSVVLPTTNAAGTATVFYEGDPSSNSQIYAVNAQKARYAIVPATAGLGPTYQARITRDGSWVYFTAMRPYGTGGATWGTTIWRIHVDGTGLEQMTSGTSGATAHSMPSPSPDGSKVMFVNQGVLNVLDVATKAVTSIGIQGQLPRYSPDGTHIVYMTSSSPSVITIANVDGSSATSVSPPGRWYDTYAAPDWSPDGKWIVARGSGLELWRVSDHQMLPLTYWGYQASFRPQ